MTWTEVDPFELPDWLGTASVTWVAVDPIRSGHRVRGRLVAGNDALDCDLFAADEACPAPVADQALRSAAHHAWQRGDVLAAEIDGSLSLVAPGCGFSADGVLDLVERLSRAVAADSSNYTVQLVVGREAPGHASETSTLP